MIGGLKRSLCMSSCWEFIKMIETQCILYLKCTNYCMSFYQVIFRFALALFKYKEEEILKLQDSMSIFKYLRYFTRTILDARWVTHNGVALKDL